MWGDLALVQLAIPLQGLGGKLVGIGEPVAQIFADRQLAGLGIATGVELIEPSRQGARRVFSAAAHGLGARFAHAPGIGRPDFEFDLPAVRSALADVASALHLLSP
jgi:hypothetical protein